MSKQQVQLKEKEYKPLMIFASGNIKQKSRVLGERGYGGDDFIKLKFRILHSFLSIN